MAKPQVGPFSPLEYAQWYLSSSSSTIANTDVILDNGSSVWDLTQKNGNTVATQANSTTNTITFFHSNYVGPKITNSGGIIPSVNLHPEQAEALGISITDVSGWDLIIVGVALIVAAALIEIFTAGAGTIVVTGLVYAGVGLIIAGAADVFFTPQLVSTTCNATSTSCCNDFTGSGGAFTTCIDCTSPTSGCTQVTSTPTGGLLGFLSSIENILIVLIVGAIAIIIAYVYLKSRGKK
ncbi:MAG: hypothetical protein WA549_01890 [Thermoplasmata archaeon]